MAIRVEGFKSEVVKQVGGTGLLWSTFYLFGYCQLNIFWLTTCLCLLVLLIVWIEKNKYNTRIRECPKAAAINSTPNASMRLLPAWVINPDTERSEWTNTIFRQLWPHLEAFLRQTIRSVEEDPTLQERLAGYHIQRMIFPTVSLGTIPPRLGGVKVHKVLENY